jgi:hypothetical protein
MAYEMNEGGFLDGGFVQAQYDRNQEYEDMRRANADAESYMRQFKANLEIEALLKERDRDLSLAAQAIPPGWKQKSIKNVGGKWTTEWAPPEELGGKPTTMSVSGGLAVVGPDGQPKFYQPPWAGNGTTDTGGFNDAAEALKWAKANNIEYPKITFEGGKYRVLPGQAPAPVREDPEVAADRRWQRQLARQRVMDVLKDDNSTPQQKADARATLRLWEENPNRMGNIETIPADVETWPGRERSWLDPRRWFAGNYPEKTVTNAPAMVTTNWYDQVLGTAPTNDMRAATAPTNNPSAAAELTDVQAQRYLALRRSGKSKAEALQMVASGL